MRICKILLGVCVLLFASAALADRVTPSDRVETRLRIRSAADGQAQVVGHLLPGGSLPLRASVPNWYEVELPDGQRGFVSKAWARLIADQSLVETPPTEIRLGSWNIRKLGHGANKDFARVAQIIETNFDIVAIVEVMQKAGGHPGYDSLLAQLGPSWFGIVTSTPRPDTSSGSAEFYAILFRPARVRLCAGWTALIYHADHTGGSAGVGEDFFSREPAFACFATTRADGAAGFDFLLAAYHAIWAEGDIGDIQEEVRHLDEVFGSMAAARPGERDLLIAGDFNLVPTDLRDVISQEVRTIGTGSTLNGSGVLTSNLYDHIIVMDLGATVEMTAPEQVLDVRNVAATSKLFFQTVSDHLPIVARFRVLADDD